MQPQLFHESYIFYMSNVDAIRFWVKKEKKLARWTLERDGERDGEARSAGRGAQRGAAARPA